MTTASEGRSHEALADYVAARLGESELIAAPRQEELMALIETIVTQLDARGHVDLVFLCTHNSRRSQFGQVWAAVAAEHFAVAGVRTWSGGTEVTAFAPPAVSALARAGLQVERETEGPNPVYRVGAGHGRGATRCWSKRFDDPENPSTNFVAVMTCSAAHEACPVVRGAAHRLAITYEDPKLHDGSPREAVAYDERCRQIAREMLFVFERLAANRRRGPR